MRRSVFKLDIKRTDALVIDLYNKLIRRSNLEIEILRMSTLNNKIIGLVP